MDGKYSFLGYKATEEKFKHSKMIPRGVSSDKLKRGKIDHEKKSVRDVININELIAEGMLNKYGGDDITSFELPEENSEDTANSILFENAPRFSYDTKSGRLVSITDRRGKTFELVYDNKGKMTEMKLSKEETKDIDVFLKKIATVERLSKELIDKSVEKGIRLSDYCTAINVLHKISNSGVYNAEDVKMSAQYAKTELEKLEILPVHGTQAYIANIKNTLRELSEI